MKTAPILVIVLVLLGAQPGKSEDTKDSRPVMVQIGQAIRKVTAERDFSNDDAARISRDLFALLVGPPPKGNKVFSDVTEPDHNHIEVNVGYSDGMIVHSYHIRFWRDFAGPRDVHIESIAVVTNNI